MQSQQRILIVTRNLPPLTGGMERLNQQVLLALQEEFDVALCGPHGCSAYVQAAVCDEFPAAPAWRYVLASLWSAIRMALKFKPDLIYAGSGAAAHAAVIAGRLTRTPAITYLHGLDIIASSRIYQNVFLPLIRRSQAVVVNSRNTARLAVQAGIAEGRIHIVHPGVTLPEDADVSARGLAFRSAHGLADAPLLLAAGRLTARKGLAEFVRHCMPAIVAAMPSVKLVIIGEPAKDALNKPVDDVAGAIRAAVQELGLEQHVILLGSVDDKTLSDAYFAGNLFIFPVLEVPGDVEGFGMVAVEAAAHGLPTAGFAVGGIPDAVAEGVSGHLAPPGDYAALTRIALELLDAPPTASPDACRRHAANFTWDRFGQKMRRVCTETMNP